MLTRKTAKDLEFDRQDDAIRALNDLKTMMRSIRGLVAYYTPEETELVKQQGRVAYENQMKRNMLRKKKPKPSKFNEKPEKYKKRLKKGRGTSKKNAIFLFSMTSLSNTEYTSAERYNNLISHQNYEDMDPKWRKGIDLISMHDEIPETLKNFIYGLLPRTWTHPRRNFSV